MIPILVDDAPMPRANQLPASLAALVRRNAVEINPLTFDTKRLMTTVRRTLAELKVPDTSTGSESPTSTPRPDPSNQQAAGPEVEQLYDQGLAAFWTEQWDRAVDLLGKVLSRQPDYAEAARKLELARRLQQLAMHYAQACAAADAGDWEQAVAAYIMVVDVDPDYRDTNARLEEARHQQQLASLRAEAHRLHRAGQWAAVIKVGEQLQAVDPAAADPDGLITSARAELAAEQLAAKLAADYHSGLHLFDAGRWKEAVATLERVTRLDSTYQDAPALLDRARQELGQAVAALAEEQTQRHAEEQATDAELVRLDPVGSDPDGLAKARAERLEAELAASYTRGVEQLEAGQWILAEATFALLLRRRAGYRDAQTLLALARRRGRPEEKRRYPPTARDNPAAVPTLAASMAEPRTIGAQQSRRQREQAKQRHTPSMPPAVAAISAADQPRADQNKSPDKKSGRLSRRARIFLGVVLTGVGVWFLGLAIVIIVYFSTNEILFEDFSSRVNGWDDAGSVRAGGHYTNGAYRIYAEPTGKDHVEVGAPRNASSVYPSAPLNLGIDVEVKALALPERNTVYGIACRYGENSNGAYGYAFNVGPDYVLIAKYGVDGNYRGIDSQPLPAEFNVNGTNNLTAECNNDEEIKLYTSHSR